MPGSSPIVLGIDPGSRVTGFGVVREIGNRLICIDCGAVSAPAELPLADRLWRMHGELRAVIERTRPDVMAVEAVFYGKNVRAAITLAHARGVALLAAAEAGIPVIEYAPMQVKKAAVGVGRAGKEQIAEMMTRLFRLAPGGKRRLADATDALAVAFCHLGVAATESRIAKGGSA